MYSGDKQVKVWPAWLFLSCVGLNLLALFLAMVGLAGKGPDVSGQAPIAYAVMTLLFYTIPLGLIGAVGAIVCGSSLVRRGKKGFGYTAVLIGLAWLTLGGVYLTHGV